MFLYLYYLLVLIGTLFALHVSYKLLYFNWCEYSMKIATSVERKTFIMLLIVVSIAFVWILQPFFGAIFWAYALAIVVYPMQEAYFERFKNKNLRAFICLMISVFFMVIPIVFVSISFTSQINDIVHQIDSGNINLREYFDQFKNAIPFLGGWLDHLGVTYDNLEIKLQHAAGNNGGLFTKYSMYVGQNTISFLIGFSLMIYLTFFLLRDGRELTRLFIRAFPISDKTERTLLAKISEVTRATIKGNLVVATIQGALGGIIFWVLDIPGALLWGVVMMFAALLPAIGAAIIWFPVALYFLMIGDYMSGAVLLMFGGGVIALVDNLLRPVLVGRDTGLPDYIVLLTTLGGLSVFGVNGLVIGPVIAALFVSVWGIFMREIHIQSMYT